MSFSAPFSRLCILCGDLIQDSYYCNECESKDWMLAEQSAVNETSSKSHRNAQRNKFTLASTSNQPLIIRQAVDGTVRDIEKLLLAKADVCETDSTGNTALHYAIVADNREVVKFLVTKFPNELLPKTSLTDNSVLHVACSEGQNETFQLLLNASGGEKLLQGNFEGILLSAFKGGNDEIIRQLIRKGGHEIIRRKPSPNRKSFLNLAIESDCSDSNIRAVLERSSKLALLNDHSCLILASRKGRLPLVRLFAAVDGGRVLKDDTIVFSAVIAAAELGHADIVRFLLPAALLLDNHIRLCARALYAASYKGHTAMLKVLREDLTPAQLAAALASDPTCLYAACQHGRTGAVRALLEWPAAGDLLLRPAEKERRRTCLHAACAGGHLPVVRVLLASQAAARLLTVADSDGSTALELACAGGRAAIAAAILDAPGGDGPLRIPAPDRPTCLDIACRRGCLDTVSLLLRHAGGAPAAELLRRSGPGGRTCLMTAAELGHTEVVELLSRAGGTELVARRDAAGWTAAGLALSAGRSKVAAAERAGRGR